MHFINIVVESHEADSIANKNIYSKLDGILKDVKEMKDLIRQMQWIEDYHKNNFGLLKINQRKLLPKKRMLGVRVCLKLYKSIRINDTSLITNPDKER